LIVCTVTKQIEKLGVHNGHHEIERIVRIGNDNEQGCAAVPQQIQFHFIGIDLSTGEFHIESENIEEVMPLHDDLFVYRGLDEEDLKNIFLVAEYVKLTQN